MTRILGKTYSGRPMMDSFALDVWLAEQRGDTDHLNSLFRIHALVCDCGEVEHDFARDMTDVPMEGLVTAPAVAAVRRRKAA